MRNLVAAALVAFALPAHAQGVVIYPTEASFEDAAFAVESAIVGRGLVIDHVSHVGEMLARTKDDVGSSVDLFEAADVFLFCSALVSRQVMEADPMNIAHCPYGIFVADRDGAVIVGYRDPANPTMQPVHDLLDAIAREAASQ